MENLKHFLAFVLLLLSISGFAQTQTKVIAVITKADWCAICKQHGARVVNEVLPLYKTAEIKIMINDMTDERTKVSSHLNLKQEGLNKTIGHKPSTGEITLISVKTKKVLSKISVAKSNDEIKKAFDHAILKS